MPCHRYLAEGVVAGVAQCAAALDFRLGGETRVGGKPNLVRGRDHDGPAGGQPATIGREFPERDLQRNRTLSPAEATRSMV